MTCVSSYRSGYYHAGIERDGKWFAMCGHTTTYQRMLPIASPVSRRARTARWMTALRLTSTLLKRPRTAAWE